MTPTKLPAMIGGRVPATRVFLFSLALILVAVSLPAFATDAPSFLWLGRRDRNCYNYALGASKEYFAQPGDASGRMYEILSCKDQKGMLGLVNAAINDGLIPVGSPDECTSDQNSVALVVAPSSDFHWYRREDDGHWTHKDGGADPSQVDDSGKRILDVQKADRGSYSGFCGYFCVDYTVLKVR